MYKVPPSSSVNQGLQLILSKRQLSNIQRECINSIQTSLTELRRRDKDVYETQKHIANTDHVDLENLLFRASLLHNIIGTIKSYSHLSGEHR